MSKINDKRKAAADIADRRSQAVNPKTKALILERETQNFRRTVAEHILEDEEWSETVSQNEKDLSILLYPSCFHRS